MDEFLISIIVFTLPIYLFLSAILHSFRGSTPYNVRLYFGVSAVFFAPAALSVVWVSISQDYNNVGLAMLMLVFLFIGLVGLFFFVVAHEKVLRWKRDGVALMIAILGFALMYSRFTTT